MGKSVENTPNYVNIIDSYPSANNKPLTSTLFGLFSDATDVERRLVMSVAESLTEVPPSMVALEIRRNQV